VVAVRALIEADLHGGFFFVFPLESRGFATWVGGFKWVLFEFQGMAWDGRSVERLEGGVCDKVCVGLKRAVERALLEKCWETLCAENNESCDHSIPGVRDEGVVQRADWRCSRRCDGWSPAI
jgi:hypothetical protein